MKIPDIKLIWFLTIFGGITLLLSMIALILTEQFSSLVDSSTLSGAPLATSNLTGLYIPPMVKMQVFVFLFDLSFLMYYIY